jgi:hypothetical protein
MGKQARTSEYTYKPQELTTLSSFPDSIFLLSIKKANDYAVIEPQLDFIRDAFTIQIEYGSGAVKKDTESGDVLIKISISRYITRKYSRRNYKTMIDCEYTIFNSIENSKVAEGVLSFSGQGKSPEQSNSEAINKFVRNVLTDKDFEIFMASISRSSSNIITHMLDKLSMNLLKKFEENVKGADLKGLRMAFAGFENEGKKKFSSIFISSLQNNWKTPKYSFYSRDKLDQILKEQSRAVSDLFDESTITELGKLKGVDYLVSGNVSEVEGNTILEAQVIRIADGEIVSSATTAF